MKSQFSSRFVRTPFPVRTASDMSLGLRSLVNLGREGRVGREEMEWKENKKNNEV